MSQTKPKPLLTTGHKVTAAGCIPHLAVGELRAPGRLDFRRFRRIIMSENLRYPVVRKGRYVHVLPGGDEILGSVAE